MEEKFISELRKHLRHLSEDAREEEIAKYKGLDNYDNLSSAAEANKIYKGRGLNYSVNEKISLFEAVSIIINALKSKDKKLLKNLLLFMVYLVILLIVIKIPFIYVRDIVSTMFNVLFTNQVVFMLWNLLFELLYAVTTIIVFIKLIKKKATEI